MYKRMILLAAALCMALLCGNMALAENETYEYDGRIYAGSDVETLCSLLETEGRGLLVDPAYTAEDPMTYGVVWEETDGIYRAVELDWADLLLPGDISLAGMEYLRTVNLSGNVINQLDLAGCFRLTHVYCESSQLHILDLAGCVSLTELWVDDNLLAQLSLTDCVNLTSLYVSANLLETLALTDLPALQLVHCGDNLLAELTIKGCPALETLHCENNGLPFLRLSDCTLLKTLCAQDNLLLAVNLEGCVQLSTLRLSGNRITALPDLTNCTQLTAETTDVAGNGFDREDLSPLPEHLTADEAWVAAQLQETTGTDAADPQPIPEAVPEYDLSLLGDVISNRQGAVFAYEAAVARQDEGWALVITALPSNDGKYYQRNLTLQKSQILALQEAGFYEVALRMNDVWVYVPVQELIRALGDSGAAAVIRLAPMAPDEWSKSEQAALDSCEPLSGTYRYRVAVVEGDDQVNVTEQINGLRVRIQWENGSENDVLRIYVVANQGEDQGDLTYYVPAVSSLGESSIYAADISGAGSGLIGLARVIN